MATIASGFERRAASGFRPSPVPMRLGLAVVACAAAVAATMQPARGPAAAPTPMVAFDGRYSGELVAAFEGRQGECAVLAKLPDLVVAGDRVWTSGEGPALRGAMYAGGLALLTGVLDGPATLTGRFEDGRFIGELRGWTCTYVVALTRAS